MAFGVTENGFQIKRLADIKSEVEATIKAVFGSGVNLDARGPFGQLVGIFSERESLAWELAEDVYNGYFPQNAQGVGVDNALSLVGLTRKPATSSIATLRFFGAVGTVIPSGTEVSRSDNSDIVFITDTVATILAGSGVDEEQQIDFSAVPDAGSYALEFDGQVTAGIPFNANAAAVQAALEALSNIGAGNVLVAGDYAGGFVVTFQGALGALNVEQIVVNANTLEAAAIPVTITPSTNTEGVLPSVDVSAESSDTGPIPAPSGTLDTLDTGPIAGFDSVTNPLDAEVGTDIESDADAKIRRNNSVANPGNATIENIRARLLQVDSVAAVNMFENTSLIDDLSGRPGKSYEAVIQGGDDDEIAQVMFETKPAGIFQVGTTTVIVKDSQGFDQETRFSRPTNVPIYLEVDLTTDGRFPIDGLQQAEDALLAYGNALNISDDVIVFTKLICALDAIPGITDVEIRVGVAPIPASGSLESTFVNDAGNLKAVTVAPHGLAIGNQVRFSNVGGALPTGLAPETTFWVIGVPDTDELLLAASRGGTALPFFDGGTGTNTVLFGGRDDNIVITDTERADFDSSRITVIEL